jgi:hypothetical protein
MTNASAQVGRNPVVLDDGGPFLEVDTRLDRHGAVVSHFLFDGRFLPQAWWDKNLIWNK